MSTAAILTPLLVAVCFGFLAPAATRRLPPQHATWLISLGSVVSALSGLAVLYLVGFVLVGQVPAIANEAHWSSAVLRDDAPTEMGVGALSLALALAAGAATLSVAVRRALELIGAYRACRGMSPGPGGLVVIADARPDAVAVPGRPGCIVVTRPLLATLSAGERRAVIAHERAHLDHGHHWHLCAVSIAVAANPLLMGLRSAIVRATERWADEEAAVEVGDRRVVGDAIARAALLRRPAVAGFGRMPAAGHAVSERVVALLDRPPRARPLVSLLLAALLLAAAIAAVVVAKEIEHLFELAGRIYSSTHASTATGARVR